jgi:hypothetical protein
MSLSGTERTIVKISTLKKKEKNKKRRRNLQRKMG